MTLTVGGVSGVAGGCVSEGLKPSVSKIWPRYGSPCCCLKGIRAHKTVSHLPRQIVKG